MGHAKLEMFIRHSVGKVKTDILIQSSGERSRMKEKLWKLSIMHTVFKGVKLMQSNNYGYNSVESPSFGALYGEVPIGEEKLGEKLVEERKPIEVGGKFLAFRISESS